MFGVRGCLGGLHSHARVQVFLYCAIPSTIPVLPLASSSALSTSGVPHCSSLGGLVRPIRPTFPALFGEDHRISPRGVRPCLSKKLRSIQIIGMASLAMPLAIAALMKRSRNWACDFFVSFALREGGLLRISPLRTEASRAVRLPPLRRPQARLPARLPRALPSAV